MIKTITHEEGTLLCRLLVAYRNHICSMPKSLIVRYAGFYRIEMSDRNWQFVTVMASVFDPEFPVHQTYDLKGSTHMRRRKPGESTAKDEDWKASGQLLHLPDTVKRELCAVHEQDAAFLNAHGVMDYSMLLGQHKLECSEASISDPGWLGGGLGIRGAVEAAPTLYYVGIIDFLMWYGVRKRGEHIVRMSSGHSDDASCVDPLSYARRHVEFVRKHMMAEIGDHEPGTRGILHVTIFSAQGLVKADVFNASDPYVCVDLGLQRLRTPVLKNRHDAEWNCTLSFAVDEAHMESKLEISVWDKDIKALQGADDFLGKIDVEMQRIVEKSHIEVREQLREVKQGAIHARIEFQPLTSKNQMSNVTSL